MAYCDVPESLVRGWKPAVAFVDADNRIVETGSNAGVVPEQSARAKELGLKSSGR